MTYPILPDYAGIIEKITEYGRLKHEYGAKDVEKLLKAAETALKSVLAQLQSMPADPLLEQKEPNDLKTVRLLRSSGPRKLWDRLEKPLYRDKLEGALLSRLAGCTLGAIVEFWSVEDMADWAKYIGDAFPPVDYWSKIPSPHKLRYQEDPAIISANIAYTRDVMNGVPIDDDIVYTLLGLMTVEEFGNEFTTEDVGKAWMKYLPVGCTAEAAALANLKAGIPALQAADTNNPYCQWIGADIRADPFAYMAPAYPEKAAEMAYYDAYLSHRRNGIYGAMFFAAAQAAAFAVDNPVDALKIGLTEIPGECALYKDVVWALSAGKELNNYKDARAAYDERFKGMSGVHTNNNACLTIFGLMLGGTDVTKVLSETVAMGMDNDCTTATAGSIVGAIAGKKGMPPHWYKGFNNKVYSYLLGHEVFYIDQLLERFTLQAEKVYGLR